MNRYFLLLSIYLVVQISILPTALFGSETKKLRGKVIKVIDGDSIKVRSSQYTYEIRLYGIDAPEYDQPYASEAKRFVKRSIQGKRVTVYPVEKDRYGRLVAIVEAGDSTINEKLLQQGLAWFYPKYCKKKICSRWKKSSRTAKKNKKNIWSDPNPMAPWRWKYNKHKNK